MGLFKKKNKITSEHEALRAYIDMQDRHLIDDFMLKIKPLLSNLVDEKFEQRDKNLESIKRTLDTLVGDNNETDKKISTITVDVATIKSELTELREGQHKQSKKLDRKVDDVMLNAQEELLNQNAETIVPQVVEAIKDTVKEDVPIKKKGWFHRNSKKM